MRPEARQLQYFVAVAEDLNFTRAAERLHVVQQSLSTAIAQLEALLGVRLFERSTRSVRLTAAGEAWLPHAREALAGMDRAAQVAEDLAAGRAGRLRIGLAATGALSLTPALVRAYRDEHPGIDVTTEHFDFTDPTGGLRQGSADVAIVRPPFIDDGFDVLVLAEEPRYAILPADHRLARCSQLQFADLASEPWMDVETDQIWCDFWQVKELRSEPVPIGAVCRTLDDLFEAARAGTAIGLVPESTARSPWPLLAFVRVCDIAPSTIAVAWHHDDRTVIVRRFVDMARHLAKEHA
jgi:DNA-binding transcriptional LysR family regulator